MNEIIIPIIIGLLAALIGGYFQKSINDRNNALKHVTVERRKWRERLREIVPELRYADENQLRKYISELKTRLNPGDSKDNYIIDKLKELHDLRKTQMKHNKQEELIEDIEEQFAHLLKHDWERVKMEASPSKINLVRLFQYLLILIIVLYINDYCINTEQIFYNEWKKDNITSYLLSLSYFFIVLISLLIVTKIIFNIIYSSENWLSKKIKKYYRLPIRKGKENNFIKR